MNGESELEPWEKISEFVRFQSLGNQDSYHIRDEEDGETSETTESDKDTDDIIPSGLKSSRRTFANFNGKDKDGGKKETSAVNEDDDVLALIHQPQASVRKTPSGRVSLCGRMLSAWESMGLRLFEDEPGPDLDLNSSDEEDDDDDDDDNLNRTKNHPVRNDQGRNDATKKESFGRENVSSNKRRSKGSFRFSKVLNHFRGSISYRQSMITVKTQSSLENTYRMDPLPGQAFTWYKARDLMQKLVDKVMPDFYYDAKSAPQLCKLMSQKVTNMMKKKVIWPRYRYVCHVTIVQLNRQGIVIADRCLWRMDTDNVAVVTHVDKKYVCVVALYAIFTE